MTAISFGAAPHKGKGAPTPLEGMNPLVREKHIVDPAKGEYSAI